MFLEYLALFFMFMLVCAFVCAIICIPVMIANARGICVNNLRDFIVAWDIFWNHMVCGVDIVAG